ncbi:Polyubiquitin [Balamuthia mandrillaris]
MVSCSNCRQAHAACDSGRPCRRCITVGKSETCRDAEVKKRGRKPSIKLGPSTQFAAAPTFPVTSSTCSTPSSPSSNQHHQWLPSVSSLAPFFPFGACSSATSSPLSSSSCENEEQQAGEEYEEGDETQPEDKQTTAEKQDELPKKREPGDPQLHNKLRPRKRAKPSEKRTQCSAARLATKECRDTTQLQNNPLLYPHYYEQRMLEERNHLLWSFTLMLREHSEETKRNIADLVADFRRDAFALRSEVEQLRQQQSFLLSYITQQQNPSACSSSSASHTFSFGEGQDRRLLEEFMVEMFSQKRSHEGEQNRADAEACSSCEDDARTAPHSPSGCSSPLPSSHPFSCTSSAESTDPTFSLKNILNPTDTHSQQRTSASPHSSFSFHIPKPLPSSDSLLRPHLQ